MLPHASWVALGQPLNLSLPHLPNEGTGIYPTSQGWEEGNTFELPISKGWVRGWDEQTGCSGMQEVWAPFPIPSLASLGCLFISLSSHPFWEKGHGLVSPFLFLLAQSSETGVILTTTHQAVLHKWVPAPIHPPHSGLLWSQRSPAACSSWKHLCCLLGQQLPGNQVPVKVNRGIFVTFKMELRGFWSCCPQLMGLLKAFLWAFFWLPSHHTTGSTTGEPVQAACWDVKPPALSHSALTATNQDNYLVSLLVFNLFLRLGTAVYFANSWM